MICIWLSMLHILCMEFDNYICSVNHTLSIYAYFDMSLYTPVGTMTRHICNMGIIVSRTFIYVQW